MLQYQLSDTEAGFEDTASTLVDLLAAPGSRTSRPQGLLAVHSVLVVKHRTGSLENPGSRVLRSVAVSVHDHHGESDGIQATMELAEAILDDTITVDGEVSG